MNNWQRFQEKIDVWIMRYSSEASASYWGINNINKTEADSIIQSLKVAPHQLRPPPAKACVSKTQGALHMQESTSKTLTSWEAIGRNQFLF